MATLNPFPFLWDNICSLMGGSSPSIDAVQAKTKVGRGIIQRIRDGETNVRGESLRALADAFGVQTWQLLVPGIDAKNLPKLGDVKVVAHSILATEVTAAIANAPEAQRIKAENILRLEFGLPIINDAANGLAA